MSGRSPRDDGSRERPRTRLRAVARYAAGWLALVLVVAVGAVVVISSREDEVSLPPVRETELFEAAKAAKCTIRTSTAGRVLRPDVTGPPGRAARPDVYTRTPEPRSLVGALRRGTIVIHYRPSLPEDRVEQLARLQRAAPTGTIVTPNADMPFGVAVTAWRRVLGCRRYDDKTRDVIRLFRGRFIGTGPDS